MLDALEVAIRVARAIETVGGAYFVGGSLASSFQGDPRATNDVDIVLEIPLGNISLLKSALGDEFEVDEAMLRDALLHGTSCNIFYLPTVFKIDLFAVGPSPFDEMEFARRRPMRTPRGEPLMLKSPEDTVLRKLLWFEAGGRVSDRQWRDVLGVLKVSMPTMDRDYMERWSKALGINALLVRATAESGMDGSRSDGK